MPIQTLRHLWLSVNEPKIFEVEEKMAATMMRVTAVTLIMTSSVVHSVEGKERGLSPRSPLLQSMLKERHQ